MSEELQYWWHCYGPHKASEFTVDELYDAFKARILVEVVGRSNELLEAVELEDIDE